MRKLSYLDFPLQKYASATSRYDLPTEKLRQSIVARENGHIKGQGRAISSQEIY